MTSIMKSPIIDSEAHRFSRSDQPFSMNRCGLKTRSYHALASP